MSNITSTSFVVTQEQLFTELTPEEGANISGGKAYELVIKQLYCVKAGADIFGDDETRLKVDGNTVWDSDMGGGSNKNFDPPFLKVGVDNGSFVGLYDEDGVWSRDDFMGGFTINGPQAATTITLSGGGSEYTLTYKVTESDIF